MANEQPPKQGLFDRREGRGAKPLVFWKSISCEDQIATTIPNLPSNAGNTQLLKYVLQCQAVEQKGTTMSFLLCSGMGEPCPEGSLQHTDQQLCI